MKILLTGGAGFIGSHLLKRFVSIPEIKKVIVVDNLSTGHRARIKDLLELDSVDFFEVDIRNYEELSRVSKGVDYICHQAALGSVPRSVADPATSYDVNVMGTLNVLKVAVENKVKRIVYASSSSVYGDNDQTIKREGETGDVLSPYAATKASIEAMIVSFGRVYDLRWIGLRYFNVFGPGQTHDSEYSAVIPKWITKAIMQEKLSVNGDGLTSRDFTYIENVIHANELALFNSNQKADNQFYNVACGESITLNKVIEEIEDYLKTELECHYQEFRKGDVPHSLASIEKIETELRYYPKVKFKEGLIRTIQAYQRGE